MRSGQMMQRQVTVSKHFRRCVQVKARRGFAVDLKRPLHYGEALESPQLDRKTVNWQPHHDNGITLRKPCAITRAGHKPKGEMRKISGRATRARERD
jgi:hypothetical protein